MLVLIENRKNTAVCFPGEAAYLAPKTDRDKMTKYQNAPHIYLTVEVDSMKPKKVESASMLANEIEL